MSLWSRIRNTLREPAPDNADDIDEELRLHLEEAAARGRDPLEARRALGSALKWREESRDARAIAWLWALRADAIFAARQLRKNGVTSAAAILSLGLAIGACAAAFRIADALLWRPLPIAHAERLHVLSLSGVASDGTRGTAYSFAYVQFSRMRDAVSDQATLLAVSNASSQQLTYANDDPEPASVQFVSGAMFPLFELRPAIGRLLTPSDDVTPGGHPFAVLSADYWSRRFGSDPAVIGRQFRIGLRTFSIVGVAAPPFIGTEPGTRVDIFLPAAMHPSVTRDDATWLRVLAIVRPGAAVDRIRDRAQAIWHAYEVERAKTFSDMSQDAIDRALALTFSLTPAASGSSSLGVGYAQPIAALAVMVLLVLLIACSNVANLMAAQSTARGREMALRASIGAGRGRLVQLVVVEAAIVALASAMVGASLASWAAPFVVAHINPPTDPARLWMPYDWRVAMFSIATTVLVTALFGTWPAIKASSVRPLAAMRGVSNRHTGRPVGRAVIGAQVAFCVFALLLSGLSVSTFARLSQRPTGFAVDDVIVLDAGARQPQPAQKWAELTAALAHTPGVVHGAMAGWPMMSGSSWNGFVSVDGVAPGPTLAQFLDVTPEFLETMSMPLIAGRGFTDEDTTPGQAIVNEQFVRDFLPDRTPLGRTFLKGDQRYEVVGIVKNAIYKNIHDPMEPVAFVPFRRAAVNGTERPTSGGAIVLQVAPREVGSMGALGRELQQRVHGLDPNVRVTSVRTQRAIDDAQTVRERLMAMLAAFFGVVALTLTGVGLYGMLHYAVVQRQREIGIRRAVGASGWHVARQISSPLITTVVAGVVAGLVAGVAVARSLQALFYGVTPADAAILTMPAGLVLLAACAASVMPVIRALRINPVSVLRGD